MADIRLSKLTKQFSIGLARLVDFLNEQGAGVEMNPNAKVSDEYLPAIEAKFGEDQKLKRDSEKVTIKLKEIIEMGSRKKPEAEEDDVPEREVVIKSNTLNEERPSEPAPVEKPAPAPVQAEEPRTVAGPRSLTRSIFPVSIRRNRLQHLLKRSRNQLQLLPRLQLQLRSLHQNRCLHRLLYRSLLRYQLPLLPFRQSRVR